MYDKKKKKNIVKYGFEDSLVANLKMVERTENEFEKWSIRETRETKRRISSLKCVYVRE